MTNKYNEETIEQYILKTLPDQERDDFEKELKEDKVLAEHVSEQSQIINAIANLDQDQEAMNAIGGAARNYFDENKLESTAKVRKIGWTKWAIAVAAGLAILLAATFLIRDQSFDAEQAFAEYFEPGTMIEIDRSTESQDDQNLLKAYRAYEQADYQNAIVFFNDDFSNNPPNPRDLNYAGMAALALPLPDLEAAASYFEQINKASENIYQNSADWHLALIALKKNDWERAISYLEKLQAHPAHKYTERSGKLLKELK